MSDCCRSYSDKGRIYWKDLQCSLLVDLDRVFEFNHPQRGKFSLEIEDSRIAL
jgi:hypothetical protein